jgi:thiol-disulfide isomerase/thioredoxin
MSAPDPQRDDVGSTARRYWLIALGLAVAWAAFLAIFGPKGSSRTLPKPALRPPGAPAPVDFNWTIADLDGRPVDFAVFRGRPVFLNIWGTWCPPCVAEMPAIDQLAANARLKDVAFVCVATDEDPETVRQFVARRKLSVPVYHAQALPPAFYARGIPATFILDAEGRIVVQELGAAGWDDPSVVDFLEQLAGEAGGR